LAIAGAWALRRNRAILVWLILAPLWLTLVQAVLVSEAPDRLAVMPPLAVLGGVGLVALLGQPKRAPAAPELGRPAAPELGRPAAHELGRPGTSGAQSER
jgi:membrane protease YdiL (CAAX protease family)